jgi:hypothetical protein
MNKARHLAWMFLPLLCVALIAAAAPQTQVKNPYAPDTPEPGSVEAIAKFTTEARFGNPWVAYVPASDTVPSPTKYLGHVVGAEGELSSTAKIYGYFRKLAETSPRVRVVTIGRSEEGRDILLVIVSDEAGIRDLTKHKEATAALADPRKTSPEAAEAVIASARPIYYFNAGLHSTETGSPEMVMELAYRLAVSEQPMIRKIRSEVVVLINPVSEPDGRDKQVDWFYRYLKGKTDFDNLPPVSPPYWGHYVFHDNNRDTHQEALELSKAVSRMFFEYHPTVIHDLHESIPLLQTWNGTGPFNANIDPILVNEFFAMAFAEVGALTSAGMPGVWTWGFGEGWGHHYLDSIAVNHNSMGRGYETFGNGTAETVERVLRPNEERYVGRPVTSREWYRPMPPGRKFRWSLRDNTNYMESGCLAILDYAAKNAKDMLRDFYRKGYNSWQKGVKGGPYAFAIPEDQGDRRRVAEMVSLLLTHRIEVSRASAPFKVGEGEFAAGTYVVRLDQPYRNYAVDLLLPQAFPPDAAYEPYDDVSWSLPVHYGVEAKRIDDAKVMDVPLAPVQAGFETRGEVRGAGPIFLLKDTGQEALLALRNRLAAFRVEIVEKAFKSGDKDYPAGSWSWPWISKARPRSRTCRGTSPRCRAWPSGTPGPTPRRSAGSVTCSTGKRSSTPTSATRTSAPDDCASGSTSSFSANAICVSRTRSWASTRSSGRWPTPRPRISPALGSPTHPRTSREVSAGRAWPTSRNISTPAVCSSRSATARPSPSKEGSSGTFTGSRAASTRRARSSRSSSQGPTIRWPMARRR